MISTSDIFSYDTEYFSSLNRDEKTIFIVSSDFCHWGDHYDYKPMSDKFVENEIYKYI